MPPIYVPVQTGARTIRHKIHKHLPEFLREFPALPDVPAPWPTSLPRQPDNQPGSSYDWDGLIAEVLQRCVLSPLLSLAP